MNAVRAISNDIIKGVKKAISSIDEPQIQKMISWIIQSKNNKILIIGAGRSGLAGKAFAMRLMHLGFDVYVMGETITRAIGKTDLIIAISGSGTTKLVVTSSEIGKEVGAKIIAITSYKNSDLGKLADHIVHIVGRTKRARETDYFLRQIMGVQEPMAPLGTIFEVASTIVLDSVIVELMKRMNKTEKDMRSKHANIE